MEKRELDNFAKQSIPILKKYGYLKDKKVIVYSIVALFIGILITSAFFYAIFTDSFKSEILTNVTPETNINNQYAFTPNTLNEYNFTPINNYTIINKIYLNCSEVI